MQNVQKFLANLLIEFTSSAEVKLSELIDTIGRKAHAFGKKLMLQIYGGQ